MTERGNDDQLRDVLRDPADLMAGVLAWRARRAREEERLRAIRRPRGTEPGRQHENADETPAGPPPQHDPLP